MRVWKHKYKDVFIHDEPNGFLVEVSINNVKEGQSRIVYDIPKNFESVEYEVYRRWLIHDVTYWSNANI